MKELSKRAQCESHLVAAHRLIKEMSFEEFMDGYVDG